MTAARRALVAATAALLTACAPAGAQAAFTRAFTLGVGPNPNEAIARTADGRLHIIYQTTSATSPAPTGLATAYLSPSGKLSAAVQALSGWTPALPGLAALPGGGLLAAFGAVSPANVSSLWTIASSDGGLTWSPPSQAYSTVAQAYGANVNALASAATPILTLAVAGGITTQQGTATDAPSSLLTDASDDFASSPNAAVDGASGAVIVSWQSSAGSGGDYLREVAPTLGAAVKVPGQEKGEVQVAGRSAGATGVYAPYTVDGSHVRLFQYGGGTVAVGSYKGVGASALGVAQSSDGRLWVMWGDDNGVVVTRSNKAVTRFEPIQRLKPSSLTLYRVYGDGQLGPLDLLVDQLPKADEHAPGGFYTRVLPLLSVQHSVTVKHDKQGKVSGFKLSVKVTDAGDAVAGAKVKVGAKTVTTGKTGGAALNFSAGAATAKQLEVTAPTYRAWTGSVKL